MPTMSLASSPRPARRATTCPRLHSVMSAASAAPASLWGELGKLGVEQLVTAYGMTETAAASTFTRPGGPVDDLEKTVGYPKPGGIAGDPALGGQVVAYKTVDPVTGADLAPGAEGELAARGPIVTAGLLRAARGDGRGGAAGRVAALRRPRLRAARRRPGADRPGQGPVQVRRRAGDAGRGRGAPQPAPGRGAGASSSACRTPSWARWAAPGSCPPTAPSRTRGRSSRSAGRSWPGSRCPPTSLLVTRGRPPAHRLGQGAEVPAGRAGGRRPRPVTGARPRPHPS